MQSTKEVDTQHQIKDKANESNVNASNTTIINRSKIGEEVKINLNNTEPKRKSILRSNDYNDNSITKVYQDQNIKALSNVDMSQVYNSDEYEYSYDGSINNDIDQNNVKNANNQMEFQFNPTGQNEKVFTYQQRNLNEETPVVIQANQSLSLPQAVVENAKRNIDFSLHDDNQNQSSIMPDDKTNILDQTANNLLNQLENIQQDNNYNASETGNNSFSSPDNISQPQINNMLGSQQQILNNQSVQNTSQHTQNNSQQVNQSFHNNYQQQLMNESFHIKPFQAQSQSNPFHNNLQQSYQQQQQVVNDQTQQLNSHSSAFSAQSNQPQQLQNYNGLMSLGGNSRSKRGRELMSNNLNEGDEEIKYDRNSRAFNEMQRSIGQDTRRIHSKELAQFMKSKQEVYNLLSTVGQYYLPPYEECTTEYLRDVFSGKKKVLLNSEVKMVHVPRLQELSAISLVEQVKQDAVLLQFLPELKGQKPINREYLFNVINTVKPEFFPENIRYALQQRQEAAMMKQNRFIEITNDMYNLITQSNMWSKSNRGRALDLLNAGTKKRKKPERQNPITEIGVNLNEVTITLPPFNMNNHGNKRFKPNFDSMNVNRRSNQQQQMNNGMGMMQRQANSMNTPFGFNTSQSQGYKNSLQHNMIRSSIQKQHHHDKDQ